MAVLWGSTSNAFQTAGIAQFYDANSAATIVADHGQCGAQSLKLVQGPSTGYATKGVAPGDARAIGHFAVYAEFNCSLFVLTYGGFPVFQCFLNPDGSITGKYNPDAAFPPISFVTPGGILPLERLTAVIVDVLLGESNTGSVSIWIDGQERYSATGITTAWPGEAQYTGVGVGGGGVAFTVNSYFSSILWLDGTGPAPWNAPLGHLGSAALFATGSGANTDWAVTGAAANWSVSDSNTPDPSTEYISSSTLNAVDTYPYSDLPLIPGTEVFHVQAIVLTKEDTAGSREIDAVVRQGGTDFLSGNPLSVPTTDYRYRVFPMSENPATSAQWALNDVNAAQFGVEITT